MALLYPPILENKQQSFSASSSEVILRAPQETIPDYENPQRNENGEVIKDGGSVQYRALTVGLRVYFEMPSYNNIDDIKHAQVVLRYQASNGAAVNPNAAPDNATLFFTKNSPYFKQSSFSPTIWEIIIPSSWFIGGAPQSKTMYSLQIRFGQTDLWKDSKGNVVESSYSQTKTDWKTFASWRSEQVAASTFGEWSNLTTAYCYETNRVTYSVDFSDFTPTVVFDCHTDEDDPLVQGNVRYVYADRYGVATSINQIYSSKYDADKKRHTVTAKIPIAPVTTMQVSFEGVTKNNTIVGHAMIPIDSIFTGINAESSKGYNATIKPEYNEVIIRDELLSAEEMGDGAIVKSIETSIRDKFDKGTIEVYRMNLYSFETLKVASVTAKGSAKVVFKDYLVEMGEEYMYIFALKEINEENNTSTFTLFTNLGQSNSDNPAYGRLMRMDSVFLTTKDHQLRLTGNVNVTALKKNTSDQFQTTIGSKYPFYSRHADINYRTFTLSGLVTLNFDPTGTFMRRGVEDNCLYWDTGDHSQMVILERDLYGTVQSSMSRRRMRQAGYPQQYDTIMQLGENNEKNSSEYVPGPQTEYDNYLHRSIERNVGDTRSDELVYMERKFREYVMNWLSDGRPKVFRSETEGNMIVMLSGISFTPEGKSGRMVYSMSGTVTEIADYSTEALMEYDLIPTKISATLAAGFVPYLSYKARIRPEDYLTIIYYLPEYKGSNVFTQEPAGVDVDRAAYFTVTGADKDIATINDFIEKLNNYNFIRGDKDPYLENELQYIHRPSFDLNALYDGMEIKIDTSVGVYNANNRNPLHFHWIEPGKDNNFPDEKNPNNGEKYGLNFDAKTGIIYGDISGKTEIPAGLLTCRVSQVKEDHAETASDLKAEHWNHAYMTIRYGPINPTLNLDKIVDSKSGVKVSVLEAQIIDSEINPLQVIVDPEHAGVPNEKGGYYWSANNLPAAITINPETGEISGRITSSNAAGTATIICEDAAGQLADISLDYEANGSKMHFTYYSQYDFPSLEIPAQFGQDLEIVTRNVYDGVTGGLLKDSHYKFALKFSEENEEEAKLLSYIFSIDENTGVISADFHGGAELLNYIKEHPPADNQKYYYERGSFKVVATDIQGQQAVCTINYGEIVLPFVFDVSECSFAKGGKLYIQGPSINEGDTAIDPSALHPIQVGTRWVLDEDGKSSLSVKDCVTGGIPFLDSNNEPYYKWSAYNLSPDFEVYEGQIIGEAQRPADERLDCSVIVEDARGVQRAVQVVVATIKGKISANPASYALRRGFPLQDRKVNDVDYPIEISFSSITGGTGDIYMAYAKDQAAYIEGRLKSDNAEGDGEGNEGLGLVLTKTETGYVIEPRDIYWDKYDAAQNKWIVKKEPDDSEKKSDDSEQEILQDSPAKQRINVPHHLEDTFIVYVYDDVYKEALQKHLGDEKVNTNNFVILEDEDLEKIGVSADVRTHYQAITVKAGTIYELLTWEYNKKSAFTTDEPPKEGEEVVIRLDKGKIHGGIGPYSLHVESGDLGYLRIYQSEGGEQDPSAIYLKGIAEYGVVVDAVLVLTDSSGGTTADTEWVWFNDADVNDENPDEPSGVMLLAANEEVADTSKIPTAGKLIKREGRRRTRSLLGNQNTLGTTWTASGGNSGGEQVSGNASIPAVKKELEIICPLNLEFSAAELVADPAKYVKLKSNKEEPGIYCSEGFSGSHIKEKQYEGVPVQCVSITNAEDYPNIRFFINPTQDIIKNPKDTQVVPGVYLNCKTGFLYGTPTEISESFNLAPQIAVVDYGDKAPESFDFKDKEPTVTYLKNKTWMFPAVRMPLLRYGLLNVVLPSGLLGNSLSYNFAAIYDPAATYGVPEKDGIKDGIINDTQHSKQYWVQPEAKDSQGNTYYTWPTNITFNGQARTLSGTVTEQPSSGAYPLTSIVPENNWTASQSVTVNYYFGSWGNRLYWAPSWELPSKIKYNKELQRAILPTPFPEIVQNAGGGLSPYRWTIELVDENLPANHGVIFGFTTDAATLLNPPLTSYGMSTFTALYLQYQRTNVDFVDSVVLRIRVTDASGQYCESLIEMPGVTTPLTYTINEETVPSDWQQNNHTTIMIPSRQKNQNIDPIALLSFIIPHGSTGRYKFLDWGSAPESNKTQAEQLTPYSLTTGGIISGNAGEHTYEERRRDIYLVAVDENDKPVDSQPIHVIIGKIWGNIRVDNEQILQIPPEFDYMYSQGSGNLQAGREYGEIDLIDLIDNHHLIYGAQPGGEGLEFKFTGLRTPWTQNDIDGKPALYIEKGIIHWHVPNNVNSAEFQRAQITVTDVQSNSSATISVNIMEIIPGDRHHAAEGTNFATIPPEIIETENEYDLRGPGLTWINELIGKQRWRMATKAEVDEWLGPNGENREAILAQLDKSGYPITWTHTDAAGFSGLINIDEKTGMISYKRPWEATYEGLFYVIMEDYNPNNRLNAQTGNSKYFLKEDGTAQPGFVYNVCFIPVYIGPTIGEQIVYLGADEIVPGIVSTTGSMKLEFAPIKDTLEFEILTTPSYWADWGGSFEIDREGYLHYRRPDQGCRTSSDPSDQLVIRVRDLNKHDDRTHNCPNLNAPYSELVINITLGPVYNNWRVLDEHATWQDASEMSWEDLWYYRENGGQINHD